MLSAGRADKFQALTFPMIILCVYFQGVVYRVAHKQSIRESITPECTLHLPFSPQSVFSWLSLSHTLTKSPRKDMACVFSWKMFLEMNLGSGKSEVLHSLPKHLCQGENVFHIHWAGPPAGPLVTSFSTRRVRDQPQIATMRSKFPVMETDKEWSIENDRKTAQGSSSEFQKPSLPHYFLYKVVTPQSVMERWLIKTIVSMDISTMNQNYWSYKPSLLFHFSYQPWPNIILKRTIKRYRTIGQYRTILRICAIQNDRAIQTDF